MKVSGPVIIQSILYVLTVCHVVRTRMLKTTSPCILYDAEFSVSKRDRRLNKTITKTIHNKGLRHCVTGCAASQQLCYSVNYNKDEMICEFVAESTAGFRKNVGALEAAVGWTYFETKDKKNLGALCEAKNPCGDEARCEDRCFDQYVCIPTQYELRPYMGNTSLSSVYRTGTSEKGIDGKIMNVTIPSSFFEMCVHSYHSEIEWWKVVFTERVAINRLHFYHGLWYMSRSNNLFIKALVIEDGMSSAKVCTNTGTMDGVSDKMFECQTPETLADALLIINNKEDKFPITFCEIKVYGFVLPP